MKNYKALSLPKAIEIRGVRVNNLKNFDIDIPLYTFVAVCGVSGSGKSSLAMGTLYAEGSRRYLETLSTYTRRRIEQASPPDMDEIHFLPSALALRQRPNVPSIRSTVGTVSETLNILRLMFSRLGNHLCPDGTYAIPSLEAIQRAEITYPGGTMELPSAESFAFNGQGACPTCQGTGEVAQVDPATLIGDDNKSIRQGAVAAWRTPGGMIYPMAAEAIGIRTDVPFKDLSEDEKEMVLRGKPRKVPLKIDGGRSIMEANYYNAYDAVVRGYQKSENEKSRERFSRFYRITTCSTCGGSRYSQKALSTLLGGSNIAQVSALTLEELQSFTDRVTDSVPRELHPVSIKLSEKFHDYLRPFLRLGLTYLSLDRNSNTLSTGELQRLQLARTLRNETTGVLYVLDEPSIGLHPANIGGLFEVFDGLLKQGNSLVVVEHDVDVLLKAQYLIEMGPGAGKKGGLLLNAGDINDIIASETSLIGPHLNGEANLIIRENPLGEALFTKASIHLEIDQLHTLSQVTVDFPLNCLTAVTGVSGAGKTALVLDSLVPALEAKIKKKPLPSFVKKVTRGGIKRVVTVDATPVGKNNRSTIATYSGLLDNIRSLFASTPDAKERDWDAGHFSYNTKEGACETCGGSGHISLDVQFLPDVDLLCPTCEGTRYNSETLKVKWQGQSIADVLALTLDEAQNMFETEKSILPKIEALRALGLGYLALGEATPLLSGGEAQRLKLVAEIGKIQKGTLFVFDEPTTGLHPQDIRTLLKVFDTLIHAGGTVIVIEHDLDLIANADYVIDMGPGGGVHGGRVVFTGSPVQLRKAAESTTGKYLNEYWARYEK